VNSERITLVKQDWQVPESFPFADTEIVPIRAGESCHWKLLTNEK
jgi:dihydroorotase